MSLLARLLTLQAQTTVVPNLLYTWGDNASGQIGNSTIINRSSPQQIGTNYWTTFSEGDNFTVAIKTDGTLWAWGTNTAYQLGLSDTINRSSPVQVTALSDWVAVSAGSSHAAAIQSDGSLYTFGSNQYGQLGKDITLGLSDYMINVTNAFVAVRDDGLLFSTGTGYPVSTAPNTGVFGLATIWNTLSVSKPWAKVTAGDTFGAALTTDGDLYLWGSGAPGGATTSVIRKETTTVKFTQLSAGYSHLMLLGADGYLYAYGNNTYGQLGNNNRTNVNSPIRIGTSTWKTIQAGGFFSMAIDSSDNVYTWGYNLYGQLGLGNRISRSNPTQLSSNISKISASGDVGAYINSSGSLFTWGFNDVGQLGLSDTIHRSSPVQVGTNSWKFLSAGSANMAAIDLNNTLWAWGNGNYYQIDPGSNQFNYSSPVQITALPCVSVRINSGVIAFQTTNNEVYTRGFAQYGTHGGAQLPPGVDKSNLSTISTGSPTVRIGLQKVGSGSWNLVSAGLSHTIATDTNNKLWAWGGNTNYQLGLQDTRSRSSPTQITTASSLSFTQISAGAEHNHALTNNGELYGWGKNSVGEVGMLKHRYSQITQIVSGWIALDQQGYLWTCGSTAAVSGIPDGVSNRSSPTQISTDVRYSHVQITSLDNVIALGANGSLWTWGSNTDGGLGSSLNPTELISRSSPAQVGTDTNWAKVSSRYRGGLAIKTDGSLWTWGSGAAAQGYLNQQAYTTISRSSPTQIGTSSWTMVSGGYDHVLAITTDGKLWAWGTNNQGQLGVNTTLARSSAVQVSAGTSFIFCAAGLSNSYAIDTNYNAWAWGINTGGQLGINAGVASRSAPVQIVPYKSASFTQIYAQTSTATLIDTNNSLWQTGLTPVSSFGTWPDAATSNPVIVGSGTFTSEAAEAYPQLKYSWVAVGGGNNAGQNRYAITTDGTLQVWGVNGAGQCGIPGMSIGTTPARSSPVQVNAFGTYLFIAAPTRVDTKSYTSISSGTSTTVAIDSNSKLYTWGSNPNGQLGFYHTKSDKQYNWLGNSQVYLLSNKGTLYMWGSNTGNFTPATPTITNRSHPIQITNNTTYIQAYSRTPVFSKIAPLDSAIAGIDIFGKLWVWGRGSGGLLGTNSTVNRIVPVQLNNKTYIDVSGQGSGAMYLLDSDYKLWGVGNNPGGNLGTGSTADRSSPVQILASSSITLLTSNRYVSMFMTVDGVLWGCGENGASAAGSYGALLTGDTIARSSPVIITSDTSWKLIRAAYNGDNASGIKSNDTLWVWGGNAGGQLGQNDRVERNSPVQIPGSWINIAWGYRGVMALRNDYTVWAWGSNAASMFTYSFGANGFNRSSPTQISVNGQFSFTQIDTFYQTASYVLTDGTVWMCGSNTGGQLGDNSTVQRSSPVQVGAGTVSPLTTLLANEATNPVSISVQLGTNNWSKVADGRDFMLATRTNETLWAWGLNTSGQLGNNDGISRSSPVQISAPTTGSFTQIVAGATHAGFIFKPTT